MAGIIVPGQIVVGGGGAVADGSITAAKLAAGAVTQAKLDAAVTAAALGGRAAITTGSYAARAASPSVGDDYLVTVGARYGSFYRCFTPNVWTFDSVAWGIDAAWVLDAESIAAQQSQRLRAWPALRGDTPRIVSGQAVPWVVASSLGGLPAVAFGTTVTGSGTTILRADAPALALGNDHSLLLAVSAVAGAGNNGPIVLGPTGTTTASVGVYANFIGSGFTGPCVECDAAGTGFYNGGTALGSGSSVKTIVWTWESATGTSRLYVNGSPASTASSQPGSTRGVLAADSVVTLGVGRTSLAGAYDGLIHAVLGVPRIVTSTEAAAFHTRATARFP